MINSLGTSVDGKKTYASQYQIFKNRLLWSFPIESESWEEHFENIQPSLTKSYFHRPSCPHEFYITPNHQTRQKKKKVLAQSQISHLSVKFPTSIKDMFNTL